MRRIVLLLLAFLLSAIALATIDARLSPFGVAWAQDDSDDDGGGGGDDDDNGGGGGGDDDDDNGGSSGGGGGGGGDDDDNGGGGGGDDDDDNGGSSGGGGGGGDDDDDNGGGGGGDDGRGPAGGGGGRDDDDDGPARAAPRRGGGVRLRDLFRPREEQPQPQRQPARRAAPAAPPPPPPPAAAPAEIVAFDLSDDDLAALLAQGFALIEEQGVAGFGVTSRRLSVPQGASLADARDAVRALPTGQDADFNHYYRVEQAEDDACEGPHCPALAMIDWPLEPSRQNACGGEVTVGMIDTGINAGHETFAGSRLEVHRLSDDALDPSQAIHGTAVAALLVGDPDSRSPGLIPYVRLVAVDAFHRVQSDERADVFTLVAALGYLVDEGAQVINLSLSGPPNTVLERTVQELVEGLGIVLVAAAGNAGPQAEPLYPAAYAPVIAVTAVDRNGEVYRRAGRGPHVDLAAPGVEVWTAASIRGARSKTGTSFAVPFVSAAAALILQEEPGLAPAAIAERLAGTARDLGEPGPDETFGAGLLSLGGTCRNLGPLPAMLAD